MMARMPAREFDEWLLFMTLFPNGIGERGRYARAGEIVAMIANVNRDPKKHVNPFKAEDVFPLLAEDWTADWGEGQVEPESDGGLSRMRAFFGTRGHLVKVET